ncbi:MAG TPA: restriction endonuclease subunit S [Chitinophagaceae bacterium]|nr:restriction endonuclease subunit S [Chitinophagaceae bacterium]
MELKKGYKKSKLGYIPTDWIECSFEDVLIGFSSGQTPYRAIGRYYTGNIPWITSGELNYNVITDTNEKITEEAVKKTNLKKLPIGTFLIAITGLEAEGTRGSCAITGVEATTNQSCMALYPKQSMITTEYLFQFYTQYGNWLAFNYRQGTKQQSYTGKIAKKLPIILPPTLKEQTAIATALSDMDELINSLEKLIEKKKAIKQGVMQELLRPKEGWVVNAPLGNIIYLQGGYAFRSGLFKDIGVPIIRISDVGEGGVSLHNCVKYDEINLSESFCVTKGDVLIAMSGATTGKIGVYQESIKAFINQRVGKFCVHDKRKSSLEFISHLVRGNKFRLGLQKELAQGAQPNISGKQIEAIEVDYPESIDEQLKIATILSDMDDEIMLLEVNLVKYKLLKQGMMQELLTGKTRLV